MTAMWKHLKLSEKDVKIITSTKHRQRETVSAASHVSDEKRKGWLLVVTVMIEIAKSLKQLVNKLQNVMFSNTRTNCMYSNSHARARGARVQGSKSKERGNSALKHCYSSVAQ